MWFIANRDTSVDIGAKASYGQLHFKASEPREVSADYAIKTCQDSDMFKEVDAPTAETFPPDEEPEGEAPANVITTEAFEGKANPNTSVESSSEEVAEVDVKPSKKGKGSKKGK